MIALAVLYRVSSFFSQNGKSAGGHGCWNDHDIKYGRAGASNTNTDEYDSSSGGNHAKIPQRCLWHRMLQFRGKCAPRREVSMPSEVWAAINMRITPEISFADLCHFMRQGA